MVNIEYTNKNGVAFRIGNTIYLHPSLKDDPILYNYALEHEMKHSESFDFKDLMLDLGDNKTPNSIALRLFKFRLKHLETFIDILPITIFQRKLTINISLLIFYILLVLLIGFTCWWLNGII